MELRRRHFAALASIGLVGKPARRAGDDRSRARRDQDHRDRRRPRSARSVTTSSTSTSSRGRASRSTAATSSTSAGPAPPTVCTPRRLLKTGESPGHAWATAMLAAPDPDDGASQLQFNPVIIDPTARARRQRRARCLRQRRITVRVRRLRRPELGRHRRPTVPSHFFVKVNVPAGTTVNVVCLVHPGMAGSFNVVAAQRRRPALPPRSRPRARRRPRVTPVARWRPKPHRPRRRS